MLNGFRAYRPLHEAGNNGPSRSPHRRSAASQQQASISRRSGRPLLTQSGGWKGPVIVLDLSVPSGGPSDDGLTLRATASFRSEGLGQPWCSRRAVWCEAAAPRRRIQGRRADLVRAWFRRARRKVTKGSRKMPLLASHSQDHLHGPPGFRQDPSFPDAAFHVGCELLRPEGTACFRSGRSRAALVPMPEATVHENHRPGS